MIGLTSKVSGLDSALGALDSLVAQFEDVQTMNRVAMEAAGPLADAAREIIHKKTGRTAAQIAIVDDQAASPGTFRVFVLVKGNRAFIGALLEGEFGSSKRKAYPWLRPANDREGGERLMSRFATILSGRLASLRRSG